MADYSIPDFVVSRVRYYNGQFLRDSDFIDEQKYHVDHLRRHERVLHSPGVTSGLGVSLGTGGRSVTVAAGSAVDDHGQQILLAQDQTLAIDASVTGTQYVVIAYTEVESTPSDGNSSVAGYTRFSMSTSPASIVSAVPAGAVVLAQLTVIAGVAAMAPSNTRAYAGHALPGPNAATLRAKGDASPGWSEITSGLAVGGALSASGAATLSSTLAVSGAATLSSTLAVSGAATLGSTLAVAGAITASGPIAAGNNLTVAGTLTVSSAIAANNNLTVAGTLTVSSAIAANNNLTVAGTLTVNSAIAANNNLTVAGTLTVNSAIAANNNVTVAGTLTASGAVAAGNNLTVAGTLTANGALAANNNVTVAGTLTTNGTLNAGGALNVGGTLTSNAITANGTITANANVTLPAGVLTLYGGVNNCMRLGYWEMGQTGLNAQAYLAINALLSTSTITPAAQRFKPAYAPGAGMIMTQNGGGNGDIDFYGIGWGGSAAEKNFPTDFTHALHINHAGRVGIAIGSRMPNAALEVAGDVMVSGKISSPGFRVTQVFNQQKGGLPLSGGFTSNGNTLLIFTSGSGWGGGALGMNILIDGAQKGVAMCCTNEAASHKSFTANALVVTGIGAGSHTVQLTAQASTSTDFNDFFTVTVLELPF